ncbi:unnamed protein product [Arabidopsis thaliana]|uniref:DUF4283 domain-containing protein n=1 Tax=Arabidopsis thaliana TaxID=3702 RepID=A0A5S9WY44_ARATH|nr:unnamed protein product [Arabidopsis thaliana]
MTPGSRIQGILQQESSSLMNRLIARPLNPRAQNMFLVIASLPRSWGLNERVHGRILDGTYVQFLFQYELDLLSVLRKEPWLFNNWFVVNQRWEIFLAIDFLTTIELWVQIRGIPMPYVYVETVSDIAHDLGHIIHIDFHEATTNQIAYIRVRVRFEITDRLRFFQRIRFDSEETAILRFQYEKLRRICSHCLRFTHQRNPSPYSLPLLAPRHEDKVQISAERVRRVLHDELCRSDMNSQSQLSDDSFSAPLTPPPTVPTPPVNLAELAATRLELFPPTTVTSSQKLMVHRPRLEFKHNKEGQILKFLH